MIRGFKGGIWRLGMSRNASIVVVFDLARDVSRRVARGGTRAVPGCAAVGGRVAFVAGKLWDRGVHGGEVTQVDVGRVLRATAVELHHHAR